MNWQLPNQLTVGRIVLAGAFFVLLGLYEQNSYGAVLLNVAFGIYLVAGVTDVLDGYLARKWNMVTAFGRIADPFVDKVLVLGAYAMFTGSNYTLAPHSGFESTLPHWMTGTMVSSVQAWMVVLIMSREFIVSAVRGYSESQGMKFPATPAGKIKMFVQSVAICCILLQQANLPDVPWAVYSKIIVVWLSVVVTLASGLAYLGQTRRVLRATAKEQ